MYVLLNKNSDENCKIIWNHIVKRTRPRNEKRKSEVLEVVRSKDWKRAEPINDFSLYTYVRLHRNSDENCKIIWNHIVKRRRRNSEVSKIIKTENWDKARKASDISLYTYVCLHKDHDKDCKIIWEHIKSKDLNLKFEILDIIKKKDWDRARYSNNPSLYYYVYKHKGSDNDCRKVWDNLKRRNLMDEVINIIKTGNWDKAKRCNDVNLYNYIYRYKDIYGQCRIVWSHIKNLNLN
jgi:hypothetical protein